MQFDDDDLKRVKDELALQLSTESAGMGIATDDLASLIARLEAAEAVIAYVEKVGFKYHPLMAAWRQSAGK